MVRNSGSPDDPGNYPDSEPTRYADYGGSGGEAYSEYSAPGYQEPTGYGRYPVPEPTPPPTPWYQRPAALVGLGVLTAAVLAFLVYAVVKFTGAGSESPAVTSTPATPSTATPSTATPTTAAPSTTEQPAPAPTGETPAEPSTTTAPAPPPTTTPTTTTPPTTTPTETVTTSVTTVTETTTKRLFPTLPTRLVPPTLYDPPPGG